MESNAEIIEYEVSKFRYTQNFVWANCVTLDELVFNLFEIHYYWGITHVMVSGNSTWLKTRWLKFGFQLGNRLDLTCLDLSFSFFFLKIERNMDVFFLLGLNFYYTKGFNFNDNSSTQTASGRNSNSSLILVYTQSSLNNEILSWPARAPNKYICRISFS